MNDFDRRLLECLQQGVPLVREPLAEVAAALNCAEQAVLDRVAAFRAREGLIREISGIFDAAALGYDQALAALRLAREALDPAGTIVAGHPGVSHCYGRAGDYNLWFTLAVSPESRLGLRRTIERLADLCGAEAHLVLPATRRYKLDTRTALASEDLSPETVWPVGPERPRPASPAELTDERIRAIRALQEDLPARRDPFAPLAEKAAMDPDMLLVLGADFLAAGWMRRYAAVLHHRQAGLPANVMVAWRVEESAADAAGAVCARLPQVSHCYLRPAAGDWPYNFYTMIHGRDREECQAVVREIGNLTGLTDHAELWTEREYRKKRVRLFDASQGEWEGRFAPRT